MSLNYQDGDPSTYRGIDLQNTTTKKWSTISGEGVTRDALKAHKLIGGKPFYCSSTLDNFVADGGINIKPLLLGGDPKKQLGADQRILEIYLRKAPRQITNAAVEIADTTRLLRLLLADAHGCEESEIPISVAVGAATVAVQRGWAVSQQEREQLEPEPDLESMLRAGPQQPPLTEETDDITPFLRGDFRTS